MVHKHLGWEEHLAELALHRLRMLEHSLEYLYLAQFLLELLILLFDLGYGFRKILVDNHDLGILLFISMCPMINGC